MTSRLGIVGYGKIAATHAAAIKADGAADLICVADPAPSARRAASERWGCGVYESVEQMLHAVEIDAACVCAPPALHRSLAERLLEAGVHVLCEKPLGMTAGDARAMAALARKRGLLLAASSKFRFVSDLEAARCEIERGTIGEPVSCELTLCAPNPAKQSWSNLRQLSGGGVVMDNGPHAYDILTVALGRNPVVAAAVFAPRNYGSEVEETADVLFRIGDVVGKMALSWTYFTKDLDYLVVHGTRGSLRLGWSGSGMRVHGDADWTPFGSGYRKAEAFSAQLAAFLGSIQAGNIEPPADAIQGLEFVEAVYEAERLARGIMRAESWDAVTGVTPR